MSAGSTRSGGSDGAGGGGGGGGGGGDGGKKKAKKKGKKKKRRGVVAVCLANCKYEVRCVGGWVVEGQCWWQTSACMAQT